ncbi:MAG: potassium-transporting ATPase KdpC subunit [Solirubrobacteraceae bacterium]|jgi:K+-transporting ATPase ATPase C chain|nr:potassium-transporting ATPase KdpC subunit [Solirubrobacteraceae bacterium]
MRKELATAARAVLVLTVVLGLGYPLAITAVSQVALPGKADGSILKRDGRVVGSRLIGQDFNNRPEYFQTRPSATAYNPAGTFFNNRGPNQASLAVQQHRFALDYAAREHVALTAVPVDAATTSASGVDPHISLRNARIQAARVGRAREIGRDRVLALVDEHVDGRDLGFAGEPGVNVLALNLALDEQARR